jgi:hypothetical protein
VVERDEMEDTCVQRVCPCIVVENHVAFVVSRGGPLDMCLQLALAVVHCAAEACCGWGVGMSLLTPWMGMRVRVSSACLTATEVGACGAHTRC